LKTLNYSNNFLGIKENCSWQEAQVVVLPVPLELTTTYMKGTAKGPRALLKASHQVELYDDELHAETYRKGIATLPPVKMNIRDAGAALHRIEKEVTGILNEKEKLILIGGEHTVTVGAVRTYKKKFPDLSILHLDAHADLRESYEGSSYNHACVMYRIKTICPFVSVGIRSLCVEEAELIRSESITVFDIHTIRKNPNWIKDSITRLGEHIYITLDLDVLDPSVMPSVGTPEPGGLLWFELIGYLKEVFKHKHVVGFDLVELSAKSEKDYGAFTAAKLLYRMIGYWFQAK
jgi:agmatinase